MFGSPSTVAIWLPKFALASVAKGSAQLTQKPLALAPELDAPQKIGEVSGAAEAFGVRNGMRVSEALARCPQLVLIPSDPVALQDSWEQLLVRLEAIGAAVESTSPGLAYFNEHGLRGIYGGSRDGVIRKARAALRQPARFGVGPTRFCAYVAATSARPRRAQIINGGCAQARQYLATFPITLLAARKETSHLIAPLKRLGINTLGELRALPRESVLDRFGVSGTVAHDLASGFDTPLRPRVPTQHISETLELPESASGFQLAYALSLLIDRILMRPERRDRQLRAVVLSARLVEGGTWREQVVFREAHADRIRMRLVLSERLAALPAPAFELTLRVDQLGQQGGRQGSLLDDGGAVRQRRLQEAARQARLVGGLDAVMRILEVDRSSRIPERRVALTPFGS